MTKNIFVTNLKEVKGIKVICHECESNWFIPLSRNPLEPIKDKCISCGATYPSDKVFKLGLKIYELLNCSEIENFDFVFETVIEK